MIDLEFSEPLNPATVVAANVFVRDSANALVPGTLSLRSGNRVVRFTPSAPFPPTPSPNNYFYVFYTNGLLDLQGAAVAGSSFYFYTSGSGDTTSPAVSAIVPSAGSTGVGVNGSIRVVFSEAVNPVSLTSDTVSVSAGGTPAGHDDDHRHRQHVSDHRAAAAAASGRVDHRHGQRRAGSVRQCRAAHDVVVYDRQRARHHAARGARRQHPLWRHQRPGQHHLRMDL